MTGIKNNNTTGVSTNESIKSNNQTTGKSLFNLKTRNSLEEYTQAPLKLPDIRLSHQDPFHDPGQKTFISVMKLNNPHSAMMS